MPARIWSFAVRTSARSGEGGISGALPARLPKSHRRECGPVGIIPWSLRATGLDVDAGDPSDLFAEYKPWALLPTRRKGGRHAYFDDGEPRPNSTWAARGCSGDVRGGSGYLILHDDGPEILVDALERRVEGERPWPQDLFELVGLPPFRVRGPVEPVCLVDTAAALNRSALIELRLEQIQSGRAPSGALGSVSFLGLSAIEGREPRQLESESPCLCAPAKRAVSPAVLTVRNQR